MSPVALSLEGKVALVTGGSRGIGAACVRLFRQAGARVAFNYRTARDAAEALVAECGGPEVCAAFAQELSNPEEGRTLVRRTVEQFGGIDILVANHGIWESQEVSIAAMSDAQWRNTLAINLDSVFGLVQAAVGQMQSQARAQTDQVRPPAISCSSAPPPASAVRLFTPTTPPARAPSSA